MEPFVEQLASLCREQVTRSKWVFVPSHAIGRTIGERIALGGTNWLNLRFVTPLDIALRMGAPFLVERGIDPSEEGLGPALMMRLLLDQPLKGGYFRPLADQPTMAQALWTTVHELRMAGVKSGRLQPEAFESSAKHSELCAVLAAYEEFLVAQKRGDMATVYEEAVRHPDWCPIQPEDCWTALPDTIWTRLQVRLIDRMPGERIKPRAVAIPGTTMPRRLSSAQVDRTSADRSATPLAFLMSPSPDPRTPSPESRAPSPDPRAPSPDSVSLFHAGGREAEIEEVFRRILAKGASLDQVEIACASDVHVALVWEKALRHEWPVTLGPGIPAPSTRPGRALIGFCDWIETDFAAGHLRRLLQSGDLGFDEEKDGFTAGQAARTLARAEAGWGRATYDLSLGLLRASYEARASDPDLSDEERAAAAAKVTQTGAVATWINKLIASVPEPSADATVPLQAVVDAALGYLERSTSRSSQLDHRAAAALGDYIGELRALGPFACPLPGALRFIRERVGSLQVATERPRPGHLYASRLAQAGYSGRPHLFVVGLEEGRVFPAATEDAVLLDAEREAISEALRLSSDRIDEAVYAVLSRLAVWSSTPVGQGFSPAEPVGQGFSPAITFSYSCRDTREFRETYASWLMLQAFRLQQGDAALSYQEMKAALGEPVSSLPVNRDEATSASAWWLRSVVGTGEKGIAAVEATFAAIARGRRAQEARDSDLFTEFDGHVPADRTGHAADKLETLPAEPKENWKIPSTEGLSSPVVADGRLFHFEAENGKDVLRALEASSGKVIWSVPIDDVMKDNQGPPGPRCTPVVDEDRVYAVSCRGQLQCLETATGKKRWGLNYTNDFGAMFIGEKGTAPGASRHGNNGSPLISGDRLFACIGGTNNAGVVCFNKKTGEIIWKSQDEQAGYAPPVLLRVRGKDQLICYMVDSLMGLQPSDGKLLWRFPIKTAYARHVSTPVVFEDIVVVSSHQVGMIGVKVTESGAEQAWLSKEAAMNFSSPVTVGRHLYGLGPRSDVICVDISNGKLLWSKPGYFTTSADKSEAAFIAFQENILMLTDGGRLVLFAANPEQFKEIANAQVCGLNWCNPAYVNGNLFVREGVKTTGQLMSVQIK